MASPECVQHINLNLEIVGTGLGPLRSSNDGSAQFRWGQGGPRASNLGEHARARLPTLAERLTYLTQNTLAFLEERQRIDHSSEQDEFGWRAFVHPDDYDQVLARPRHCLRTGDHYDVEHRLRRADGVYRWFRNSGRSSRDSQGRYFWAACGMQSNLEGTEAGRLALRDCEPELSQLVDMVPSHLWRLAPDGEPIFFSKRMVDFIGLDVTDIGKSRVTRLEAMIETCVHPTDAAGFRPTLGHCLVTGQPFAMSYRLRRADGIYRWMSSRAEPMRDQAGDMVRGTGSVTASTIRRLPTTNSDAANGTFSDVNALPIHICSWMPRVSCPMSAGDTWRFLGLRRISRHSPTCGI